jgi:autotransporter-associated beta strand protein
VFHIFPRCETHNSDQPNPILIPTTIMKPKITTMKNRLLLPTLLTLTLATGGAHAATGTWTNLGDTFWDATANTEWTGVTGNAWNAANGPNNVAQFNAGLNANIGTSGTPVANGIIWNGVGGGISSGGVKLDGTSPFVSVSSGQLSNFYGNLTGTNGFTKIGAGTMYLDGGGGVKGITGGITVSQGQLRLVLGASPNTANSSNTLSLSGGQLEAFGNGTQTLSTFTLGNGGSRIALTPNGALNSTTLSLADWTRASNSSALIDLAGSGTAKTLTLTGTLPTLTNSLIGGYATVRDSSTTYGFATLDGSNNVVRYTGATTVGAALGADTVSTTNYQATAGGALFNGSSTTQYLNSLDIAVAPAGDTTITISGNNAATYVLGSGGLLFSGNISLGKPVANMKFTSATSELQVSTLSYNTIYASGIIGSNGGIYDNGSAVSLVKGGPGGFKMSSGTFAYTGDTIVNEGVLDNIANIPSGTGKGNLVVNSRGIVAIGITTSGTRIINGLSNTTLAGGTVNNQGYTSTAAMAILDLGNNDATTSFSGVISGNFSIIKSGTGTQTFSGANTYAGTTAVNAGTLLVNNTTGSGTGTGNVTVGANGTLGGTGSISGATTVDGKLAPGTSIGKLSFTGGLTLGALAANSLKFELGAPTTAGVDYDTVATSALEIGTLDFTDFQFTGTPALGVYTLISSTAAITGSIGTVSGAIGGFTGTISISGNNLILTVTSGGDTTAPSWIATYPKVSNVTSTSFNALAETDETGSAYFLVLADGATPPTSATVQSTGTAIALTANVQASSAVTGLTPATSYDVYFVAQDAIPNLQTSPVKVDVTTQTAYADWADNYSGFTPTSGGLDFDNDGISNLLEFVFGGSPIANDSPSIQPTVSASGADLVLSFKRSDLSEIAPATTVKVQLSADLLTWNPADDIPIAPGNTGNAGPIGASNASYTISNSGGMDTVTVTIPKAAATKKFARVIAIQP